LVEPFTINRTPPNRIVLPAMMSRLSGGVLVHHAIVRAQSTRYEDSRVTQNEEHSYATRTYGFAGNRSALSNVVAIVAQ
jgi:hypothetical protein